MQPKLTPSALAFSELLLEVFRVNGLALGAGDALAGPAGLTSARWQVLGVIDHAPTPVATIARTMGLTRQSVQQTTDALVVDGFAEIRDNPNHRRAHLVAITQRGTTALRAVERRHATWAARLATHVGATRLEAGVAALRAVRGALEEDL